MKALERAAPPRIDTDVKQATSRLLATLERIRARNAQRQMDEEIFDGGSENGQGDVSPNRLMSEF